MRLKTETVPMSAFEDTGFGSLRVNIPLQFTVNGAGVELKHKKLTAKWKIDTKASQLAKASVKWTGNQWDKSLSLKVRDFFRHYLERDTPSPNIL